MFRLTNKHVSVPSTVWVLPTRLNLKVQRQKLHEYIFMRMDMTWGRSQSVSDSREAVRALATGRKSSGQPRLLYARRWGLSHKLPNEEPVPALRPQVWWRGRFVRIRAGGGPSVVGHKY